MFTSGMFATFGLTAALLAAPPASSVVGMETDQPGAVRLQQFVATVVNNDGRQEIRVLSENDSARVWVNGEEIPADRLTRDERGFIVLDEQGNEVHIVPVTFVARDGAKNVFLNRDSKALEPMLYTPARPRIGVTMGALDGALREHLGVEEEGAFTVTDVVKGLAASKAGLLVNDVVVRINGVPASQDLMREVVREADEGDTIRLKILRRGEPKEISITIEKVDELFDLAIPKDFQEGMKFDFGWEDGVDIDGPADLGVMRARIAEMFKDGRMGDIMGRLENLPQLQDLNLDDLVNLRLRIAEAHELPLRMLQEVENRPALVAQLLQKALESIPQLDDPATRAAVETAIREAMKNLEQRVPTLQRDLHEQKPILDAWGQPVIFDLLRRKDGHGDGQVIVLREPLQHTIRVRPQVALDRTAVELKAVVDLQPEARVEAANDGQLDERMQRIEERLQRLEALLERIAERLDR